VTLALVRCQLWEVQATMLALNKDVLKSGDGIVGVDIEETIRNVGELAQSGMKGTDETILDIMTK